MRRAPYLFRLAKQRNRIHRVLASQAVFRELKQRPLSLKAEGLLDQAGQPPVGRQELALVELLRVALDAHPTAPERARDVLELCDQLVLAGRPSAAYRLLLGFEDTEGEPGWHELLDVSDVDQGFAAVVKMASGSG